MHCNKFVIFSKRLPSDKPKSEEIREQHNTCVPSQRETQKYSTAEDLKHVTAKHKLSMLFSP